MLLFDYMKNSSRFVLLFIIFLYSCGGGGSGTPPPFTITTSLTSFTLNEDNTYTGKVNFSVSASESYNLVFTVTNSTSNGMLSLTASTGAFTYSPNANFNGSDSFSYSVSMSNSNGSKNASATGNASIVVNPVNDPPTINLEQLEGEEDDSNYPLRFVNENDSLISFNMEVSDVDNPTESLTVSANLEIALPISFDSNTGEAILDLSSVEMSGKKDIEISVSDGNNKTSSNLTLWMAREIEPEEEIFTGDKVYQLTGNSKSSTRRSNFILVTDGLEGDTLLAARKSWKQSLKFLGENTLGSNLVNEIFDNYYNFAVIETNREFNPLGIETGCYDDESIFCFGSEFLESVDQRLSYYFDDTDYIGVITYVEGRGAALTGRGIFIQDYLGADNANQASAELTFKHESGHLLGLLGDEYSTDYENGNVDCETDDCSWVDGYPNTTAEDNPADVRWKHRISDILFVPGFHDQLTELGIGMFEGTYYGPDTYRATYSNLMRDMWSDWRAYRDNRIASDSNSFDPIQEEAIFIETLKNQGLHDWGVAWDLESVTFTLDIHLAENMNISWYLNDVKLTDKDNALSVTIPKKSNGWDTLAYRISETSSNFLQVIDSIDLFNDVYDGLLTSTPGWWYCPENYSDNENFVDAACKDSSYHCHADGSCHSNARDYQSFSEYMLSGFSDTALVIDQSGRGSAFAIKWDNWQEFEVSNE